MSFAKPPLGLGAAHCKAMASRVVIEQAKGIVAEHNGVAVDTAFELLRGYARTHNSLLRQTAQQIIDGTLASDALIEPARRTRD